MTTTPLKQVIQEVGRQRSSDLLTKTDLERTLAQLETDLKKTIVLTMLGMTVIDLLIVWLFFFGLTG